MKQPLSVILHGGAGSFVEGSAEKKLPFLKLALDSAWEVLCRGLPGEHAVAAALRVMEGCQYFNAGYGGYPNADGIVLLDVGLMRGTGDFASLINVRRVKFPSAVALSMLRENRHILSIWTYELERKLDAATPEEKELFGLVERHEDLIAPHVRKMLASPNAVELKQAETNQGTVGCVVRDCEGSIHAGTSTGGVSLKYNGRVGDSPIIGSGVFADNEIGGLSTTGHGEAILRSGLSGFILGEMRNRLKVNPAVFEESDSLLRDILQSEIDELGRKTPTRGGAIVVMPTRGEPAFAFNTQMLSLGLRDGTPERVWRERVAIEREDSSSITFTENTSI